MKFINSLLWSLLATSQAAFSSATPYATFNYVEAMQKAIWFYDVQRSGQLGDTNRVSWRGDSAVNDGQLQGVDLAGGFYDAGDHVKFGLPAAYTTTILAWSLIEDGNTYANFGQYRYALNNLRWSTDYFIKAHTAPNELWGQVGIGGKDHNFWGAPEGLAFVRDMERTAFKIDATCPGSDLAGETAAAMAAASIVFKNSDPAYADKLLQHAKQLYSFADQYRGRYSECIHDAQSYYNSFSGYQDELVWAAAWLYRATGDVSYLTKAEDEFTKLSNEVGTTVHPYRWSLSWDDTSYGSYILLAQLTGKPIYRQDAQRWLDYWTDGYQGQHINYTPGGLAYLDQWGALRYTSATSMMALFYADYLSQSPDKDANILAQKYRNFAKRQIDYILGDNPRQSSYVVGFGNNSPLNPHHRAAHGSWGNNIMNPAQSRHTLYGALVGGPDQNDSFKDDRNDYVRTEVALDYNAPLLGSLARLAKTYGGNALNDFPTPETPQNEYFVMAKVNAAGQGFIEISGVINNHSAWPAKVSTKLSYRYFVNIQKLLAAGLSPTDITITTAYNQASSVSALKPWDAREGIYYVEASFNEIIIAPISDSDSRKEVQFRINVPVRQNLSWDPNDDFSYRYIQDNSTAINPRMPIYDNGVKIWGEEPARKHITSQAL